MLLFKLVVILYLISSTSALLNTQLVIDFLKFKSLQLTCVFNCFSRPEQVTFSKHLMKEGIRIMGSTINHHNSSLKFVKEKLINHIGIIVDNECNNVEDLLEQAGKMRLFHFMQHWLVITSNNNIYNEFKNLHFHINADFIVAIPNRDNLVNGYEISEIWNIFDVYNPAHHRGGKLKIINYGTYNRSNGFIVDKRNKYERRKNMNEVTFKSTVVVREDINQSLEDYLTINNSRGIDAFNKCHCRFMYHCGAYFNFDVSMKKAHSWGYNKTKDGQHYGGILEYLQKKEVDYVCTGLWYVKDRLSFVSHAPGIWTFTGKFMFRRPSQKMFVEKFLHPMENSVWLVTLGILALIIVSLRFTQATEPKLANRPKESLDSSWSILFVITLGALFQQDFFFNSKLFGGRIVIMCVLLFCLIFYQFYSGSIVSSLLVEPSNKIKTGKDLLESPLRIATDDTPYFVNYYKNTTNPVDKSLYYNKILKGKGNQPNHYKPAEGLELVKNGGVAYQVEETEAYEIIKSTFPDKAICDLGEVLVFPKRLLTTGVQKDSPYRDMFTHCTTYLIEVGIGDYLKKLFGSSKPECLQGAIELTISVGLAEIFPAIALLGMGMLTSFITLLLEIYMKRRHTRIKHNVN